MNKTKIDWATMSWNPVTGCRHGCPYCYARRTARRFDAGCADPAPLPGGLHVLTEKIKATPYPYGFEPTMHRYRLNQPERQEEPQTVFVCSMADRRSLSSMLLSASVVKPMMAFMGVRMSWDILERKVLLARLAVSAAATASESA